MFGRQLPRPGAGKTPVVVVTGFLGAGKTTIIRSFLQSPEGARTAVIVNEYGEVGIDDALLSNDSSNVLLLGNGCICCRVLSSLQQTCLDLLSGRESGSVPSFDRIVIETSGLADPGPILQTFLTERSLGSRLYLQSVVAVVDPATFEDNVATYAESRRQVLLADRIVLTKLDLTDSFWLSAVEARIREINPYAPVARASRSVNSEFLFNGEDYAFRAQFSVEPVHDVRIETFVITLDGSIEWNSFSEALNLLVKLRGADLLRVKGLVNVQGCSGPVVIQTVQHVAYPPEELQRWPSESRESRIVCIVRDVEPKLIETLLRTVQTLGAPKNSIS